MVFRRMSDSDRACYVYCVVPESADLALSGLTGVDPGSPVATLTDGGLSAVISHVPLEQFGAEALKRNLEDLEWLERTARAHDAVLARALGAEAVVPLRLCTIFTDEEGVRGMLERGREFLLASLDRLRGKAEWSVKVLADQARIETAVRDHESVQAGAAGGGSETPGRAFFARKKAERFMREQARAIIESAAQEAHDRLRVEAAATTLLPPQRPELSGRVGDMVLNGAYLVDRSRAEAFAGIAQELAERDRCIGLELDLAGPFAPYNFVPAEERLTATGEP
jgi:Gas vesicle synthesis protein GvpL/GvpF